jgi:hypoxanthine phosphoribosyltransferase
MESGETMETMKKEILIPRSAIEKRVRELAHEISRDYEGGELIVIGVLKGAFIFMADLIRALAIPCRVDFIRLASYGSGSTSTGQVVVTKDIEISIEGRDVLVVEDIVDTGVTLSFLVEKLRGKAPRSLKVCAFLDKRRRRKVPFEADYVGFTIEDGFVVGYGLDFDEKARFLPDVYVITE